MKLMQRRFGLVLLLSLFAGGFSACTNPPRDERLERPAKPPEPQSRLSAHSYEIALPIPSDVDSQATPDAGGLARRPQGSVDRIAPVFAACRFELPSSREWMRRIEEFQLGTGFDSGGQYFRSSHGGLPNGRSFLGGSFDPGMLDNSQW